MDPKQINWDTDAEGVTAHFDLTCNEEGRVVLRSEERSQSFSNKEEALQYLDSLITYGIGAAG